MQFYQPEKINETITVLRSLCGELLYLIEGEEKAILIDTGEGVGHLRKLVESLTDKPLTVLLSHGHVDHAPGAPEFDTVYMNVKDLSIYRRMCTLEERKGYLQACMGSGYSELTEEDFVAPDPDQEFLPLHGGMEFDIGGIHIEAYDFPGHTPGCMAFLVRELRTLILGDACNNATFLFDEDSTSLEEYIESVKHAKAVLDGKYDHVYLMHHVMETGTEIMDNILDVCAEAMAGTADDIPFDFLGNHAFIAKKCNQRFEREDGKCGNIIYNKEKRYKSEGFCSLNSNAATAG